MALTLEEAAKLSNDMLMQGVVETIVKDSPVLQRLPFIEIVGNGLTYNQEKTLPNIDFYDVGDTWAESTPTFEQVTANLKIMGGDADVDNFLKSTRSNVQDLEAAVIELKAKALKDKFEENFIYGDSGENSKQFDGLRTLIDTESVGDQVVAMSATGARWVPILPATNLTPHESCRTQVDQAALFSRRGRTRNMPTKKAKSAEAKPRSGLTAGHTQVTAHRRAKTMTCAHSSPVRPRGPPGRSPPNR